MLIPFHEATFLKSVMYLSQLSRDEGTEIAFAGRSNAGKSSALNAITDIKGLAKTSKTPGRTQTINLFHVTEHYRLVDLPGYGYAKVPLLLKQQWQKTLHDYLQTRQSLKGLWLIMDIRHPLQPLDWQIINWAHAATLRIHILLTKADKLSYGAQLKALNMVKKQLANISLLSCQTFSSITGEGLVAARKLLGQCFNEVVE